MEELKTNYVDDVLDAEKNQLRKYQMITNDDGTVSFVDVTNYTTVGTNFGSNDVNAINGAINELNSNLIEKISWVNVGSTNLGTSKTIKFNDQKPTDPKEVCIRIFSTDIYYNTWLYTIPVIKNVAPLVSWGSTIRFGDSSSNVQISFNDTSATLAIFNANGSNYIDNANTTFAIYMR